MTYRVFISHGSHDRWIARQMARLVRESGAEPFIDIFDIARGDRFVDRIRAELKVCDELVALITPWSVNRNWLWTEMGAAWTRDCRVIGVLYGLTLTEIETDRGGAACLMPTNVATLDQFDDYLIELAGRTRTRGEP